MAPISTVDATRSDPLLIGTTASGCVSHIADARAHDSGRSQVARMPASGPVSRGTGRVVVRLSGVGRAAPFIRRVVAEEESAWGSSAETISGTRLPDCVKRSRAAASHERAAMASFAPRHRLARRATVLCSRTQCGGEEEAGERCEADEPARPLQRFGHHCLGNHGEHCARR